MRPQRFHAHLSLALVLGCRPKATTVPTDAAPQGLVERPPPPREPLLLVPPPVDAGPPPRAPREPPRAAGVVRIGAGLYHAGSLPGDPGRDPAVEPDLVPMELSAMDIDTMPYPNDPAQPIVTGYTRDQAERACAARGRRLCSELEWERACRGPDEDRWPMGRAWDPACLQGPPCASGYGVFSLGTAAAEWTRDDLEGRAVVRGASPTAAPTLHRCAARRTVDRATPGLDVAFRCCSGPTPTLAVPREVSRRAFLEHPLNLAQVSELIAQVPELERLHLRDGLGLFLPAAVTEVLNHGSTTAANHPEYTFTANPVRWSPTFGEELLVLVGRSRVGSWVAALWVLPDNHYRHASSFLLQGDAVSLTLAYGTTRTQVRWAACWNCGGEYGEVVYTPERRVIVVQH